MPQRIDAKNKLETASSRLEQYFESELFKSVQSSAVFNDSKTFVDARPNASYEELAEAFVSQVNQAGFDLEKFVKRHFSWQHNALTNSQTLHEDIEQYIERMWQSLKRDPLQPEPHSTLIPLPNPYLVPGGRFREIYYWDSYFTCLGLQCAGEFTLIENMIDNFVSIIGLLGHVPNGNRLYYKSRSQPPVLFLMIKMLLDEPSYSLSSIKLEAYLEALEQEYQFWMDGRESLSQEHSQYRRVVKMPGGEILNRYWDDNTTPRPESYCEDIAAAMVINSDQKSDFYRHLRAACESGWDFSSRWLSRPDDISSIRTTDIVPVDLNCLLFMLEEFLEHQFTLINNSEKSLYYASLSKTRKSAINKYCYDDCEQFYFDYDITSASLTTTYSLAAVLPLYAKISNQSQATCVMQKLKKDFLKEGGLLTTLHQSHQQWDSPNAWAPLQWFSVVGMSNYHFNTFANTIASNWTLNVSSYFTQHGMIMEKYNAIHTNKTADGGEYQVQHGFGWTNGVYMALKQLTNRPD